MGAVSGLEKIKLKNPASKALIKSHLEAGKTPGEAVAAMEAKSVLPTLSVLKKYRHLLGRDMMRTTGAFGGVLASYWATTTGKEQGHGGSGVDGCLSGTAVCQGLLFVGDCCLSGTAVCQGVLFSHCHVLMFVIFGSCLCSLSLNKTLKKSQH